MTEQLIESINNGDFETYAYVFTPPARAVKPLFFFFFPRSIANVFYWV